jgi:DNA processing protein
VKLAPDDPGYPEALLALELPPPITTSGPLPHPPRRAVAIVGSRDATPSAIAFAELLASHLARAGLVVVSGGAVGIDAAAHRGAIAFGGSTWLVAPHGREARLRPANAQILAEVLGAEASGSRAIWPFDDRVPVDSMTPRRRNAVLVALSECVVVVQAKQYRSGTRNAARWARDLGRPVWVVPAAPWEDDFYGSRAELQNGFAEPLWSIDLLFERLGLAAPVGARASRAKSEEPFPLRTPIPPRPRVIRVAPAAPSKACDERRQHGWTSDEKLVFSCVSRAPTQRDDIIEKAGLPTSATITALLTLSLKDVVVEGPDGFFRCKISV